ncbi:MAG: hypothetical protein C3F11_13515 [Methylocystaceae bacterium]|nr:MAG: hypothetical protein C3F11_13515 [Methylocystaceae bacterium]
MPRNASSATNLPSIRSILVDGGAEPGRNSTNCPLSENSCALARVAGDETRRPAPASAARRE